MENLIFSLNVTLPIFLTIVIGYVLKQIHMLNDSFVTVANKFNFKVTLPALLFLDLYQADFFSVWDTGYVLYCFFATLICFTVIMTGASLFLKDKDIIGEFVQGSYRGSAAVLGLAFIQNIYGKATIAPLMIIGSVPLYNILAVLILSFTGPGEHKLDKKGLVKSLKGIATNPIILGILFGLLASVSQIKLPLLVTKTMSNLSVMATPLALIALGAGFEVKAACGRIKPALTASFIRLFVQCAVFLPVAAHFSFTGEKMVSLLIMLGAPTTPSCYIMAKNMGHEGVLTSSVIVLTTLLSSVSLTFWLFILKTMGLI